jgi:hypothetical protein
MGAVEAGVARDCIDGRETFPSGVPHSRQNFVPSAFSVLQVGQISILLLLFHANKKRQTCPSAFLIVNSKNYFGVASQPTSSSVPRFALIRHE